MRSLLLLTACLVVAATLWLFQPWQYLPGQWNPAAPLALDHDPTVVSRWKLAALDDAPDSCLALLAASADYPLEYLALADHTPVAGCPLTNVVRIHQSQVEFSSSFVMRCPLLVRWLMFESQQLQALAIEHLGSPIQRVEHLGTFACRNVYGRETGRISQHATASAFDIAGFLLEDGRQVNILDEWDSSASADGSQFLREIHRALCRYFGTVLGPDYNRAHANHFHMDNSRFGLCR